MYEQILPGFYRTSSPPGLLPKKGKEGEKEREEEGGEEEGEK